MRLCQTIFGYGLVAACLLCTPVWGQTSSADQTPTHSQYVTKFSTLSSAKFRDLRTLTTPVIVQKVIDGTSFLGRDNQIYRLASLDIPDPNGELGARAIDALRSLIEGKELRGFISKKDTKGRTNRLGQIIIHAVTKDNIWVQGYMLENGLARVATTISNAEQANDMLKLETLARNAQKNIWANDASRLITSDEAVNRLNSFQIVEGKITSVATIRNQMYLNFGLRGQNDWRKDFTIGLSPNLRKSLARRNINSMELQNARVRVRGWVQNYNGPYIELTHPEQLELLSKGSALPQGAITRPITPDVTNPSVAGPSIIKPSDNLND